MLVQSIRVSSASSHFLMHTTSLSTRTLVNSYVTSYDQSSWPFVLGDLGEMMRFFYMMGSLINLDKLCQVHHIVHDGVTAADNWSWEHVLLVDVWQSIALEERGVGHGVSSVPGVVVSFFLFFRSNSVAESSSLHFLVGSILSFS